MKINLLRQTNIKTKIIFIIYSHDKILFKIKCLSESHLFIMTKKSNDGEVKKKILKYNKLSFRKFEFILNVVFEENF